MSISTKILIMSKYIEELRKALSDKSYDSNDIEKCLKYAKRLLDSNLPVIFDMKHLSLLLGIEINYLFKILFDENRFYKRMDIKKKSGGIRKLSMPSITLRYIQRWILDNILVNIRISEFATGFCNKKSILTNAIPHTSNECIINLDIKDFFPSISKDIVFRIFNYYGYSKEVSFALSKLCTYREKLPQGSPASPCLSNIACLKLDKRISKLLEKYNANYSRYADDITISGNYGIKKCLKIIKYIIEDEGFCVNNKKTRIRYKHQRQEVTGLIVNEDKVKVSKKYKKKLKKEIYFCTKFGVSEHLAHIESKKAFYKEHLYGKAYFIKMVEPEEGKNILAMLDKIIWNY